MKRTGPFVKNHLRSGSSAPVLVMTMQSLVFEIAVGRDELGEPEVCTWDLLPVVNSSETSHLDENGLPKIGTKLRPGMIMVGKIGKAKGFHRSRKPTNLELHGLSFNESK